MQIEEFVVLHGIRLAVIIGLVAFSEGALASDDASPSCVDVSKPKATVAALHGHWVELNAAKWEFLRRLYDEPRDAPGVPNGDRAAVARFDGDSRGIVFFIDDNKACTPMMAPAELLSMMADVAESHGQAPGRWPLSSWRSARPALSLSGRPVVGIAPLCQRRGQRWLGADPVCGAAS
jgi:hypothetical protein